MSIQKVDSTKLYKQGDVLNYNNYFQKQTITTRITNGNYAVTPRVHSSPYMDVNIAQVSGEYVHIGDFS